MPFRLQNRTTNGQPTVTNVEGTVTPCEYRRSNGWNGHVPENERSCNGKGTDEERRRTVDGARSLQRPHLTTKGSCFLSSPSHAQPHPYKTQLCILPCPKMNKAPIKPAKRGRRKKITKATPEPSPPASEHEDLQDNPEDEDDQEVIATAAAHPVVCAVPEDDPQERPDSALSKSSGGRKRATRTACRLREDQEDVTIEWIALLPCLWNQKDRDFKNRAKKDGLWQEKANELGVEVKTLKTWYTDLRDSNTKLHALKSGDPAKVYTDREKWVMRSFAFLQANIRHRSRTAPVKSVQAALHLAEGDLEMAEQFAAEDRLNISNVDETPAPRKKSKASQPLQEEADLMVAMRGALASASAQVASATEKCAAGPEPLNERTAFCNWMRAVATNASEEQYAEFQSTFLEMHGRWKNEERAERRRVHTFQAQQAQQALQAEQAQHQYHSSYASSSSTQSPSPDFQITPEYWRTSSLPPALAGATLWQSQEPDYNMTYSAMLPPLPSIVSGIQAIHSTQTSSGIPAIHSTPTSSGIPAIHIPKAVRALKQASSTVTREEEEAYSPLNLSGMSEILGHRTQTDIEFQEDQLDTPPKQSKH
jgi:hypothetical protein